MTAMFLTGFGAGFCFGAAIFFAYVGALKTRFMRQMSEEQRKAEEQRQAIEGRIGNGVAKSNRTMWDPR